MCILRFLVDLHDLDQHFPDDLLLNSVHGSVPVFIREDQPKGRVDIVADFFAPSRDEPCDNIASKLERIQARVVLPGWPYLSPGWHRALWLFLNFAERVEKVEVELMEWQRWPKIVGSVWVSVILMVSGRRSVELSLYYFSSKSSSASSTCSGTASSESMVMVALESKQRWKFPGWF